MKELLLFIVLNHETTKKIEIHEIFESRLSWILLDFTEENLFSRNSLRNPFLFFSLFFASFFFFRVFAIQSKKRYRPTLSIL